MSILQHLGSWGSWTLFSESFLEPLTLDRASCALAFRPSSSPVLTVSRAPFQFSDPQVLQTPNPRIILLPGSANHRGSSVSGFSWPPGSGSPTSHHRILWTGYLIVRRRHREWLVSLLRSVARWPHEHGGRRRGVGVPGHGSRDEGWHPGSTWRTHPGEHESRAEAGVQQGSRRQPELLYFRLLQPLCLGPPVLKPDLHLEHNGDDGSTRLTIEIELAVVSRRFLHPTIPLFAYSPR